jgi:hypothetical protein
MQIPIVKKIVAEFSIEQLQAAEEALLNEEKPSITIEGEDEGEQLTHVMAAIWIKNDMETNNNPLPKALRNYTEKVRKSIS